MYRSFTCLSQKTIIMLDLMVVLMCCFHMPGVYPVFAETVEQGNLSGDGKEGSLY